MDIITLALAKKGAKEYTDTAINNLPKGVVYRGSVNYYKDLPNNAEIGDCYSVLYNGESGSDPSGAEYVWGTNTATSTNEWTQIGQDLTNYVKNTDYATGNTAGVIKVGNGTYMNSGNWIAASEITYANYQNQGNSTFIGKGTLENVISGKGLVSNTDYASENTAGVIKVNSGVRGTGVTGSGALYAVTKTYEQYTSADNSMFIGKGTLDNVLTATVGDISAVIDAINGEAV